MAAAAKQGEVTLRVPSLKKSETTPFLCLTDPSSSSGVPDPSLPGFAIDAFTRVDNPKRRAIGISNERTAASAKNYGKNVPPKLEKFFVFALQEDGEAVLVNKADADGAFTLRKEISEDAAAAGAASYAPPPLAQANSQRERHAQLEEQFGSRKRRKTQKKLAMAAISADRVVNSDKLGGTLDKFLSKEEAAAADDEGSAVSSNLRLLLPPFDDKAETPQEAYPSTGFFPPEDRPAVQEIVNNDKLYFESKYANSRFTRTNNSEQKKLAVYFECLFRFHLKVRTFVSGASDVCKAMDISSERLGDSLLRRFAEAQPANLGGGWGKTRILKDKLLINLLIVALALDAFRISSGAVKAIADDLKIESAILVPLLYKVGCRISVEGSSEKLYELKVPLKFPEEKRRGGKRRG